ncbi:alanine--tRNA ligase [Paracidovorax citrulli]|uniref:Alanine--tRNA ligase n=3 Tax=Pseudomonadota TaxID=1224 RepID=SYA_PARC0|nr:alanine--tRNA ligase [Paracidovorax citrulli]A1TRL4.1 RecName: Full=Alanine--tRNA ligase; AltName: Full=Alanyl-tRNA synthetase; Short=AlaRS [Paracidovorax citrulli AAC00-1]ABM33602.1 alanyl-tRNA synthetase [Paracidovorax citrulli AAC00-1]ATG94208.1 alanine--tRNA ligase [Paracidovorax citrulli]PVY63030.1 alanyl-tRNA synthetase [Paracidovorax citrulli]QCX12671.1 Alanine--tRNA ligase [Paracidovorax citrulli]REG67987.1 alanyl-tRNA synthetase [Paracidovorax citrulli]
MTKPTPPSSVADIRKSFLDFFASKGHTVVPSSPLVPGNDPTLMFTNSGMVQFKDVFLGTDKRPYVRATSVQACLRAGGKHNDLENVGYTARHHTFFEMLGNWSFGDYFKRDSLKWAWELLTEVYGLPKERLLATVYAEDDEAYDIWTKEIGLPPERVIRIGDNKGGRYKSDNFWMMADTGPCGPCSEIFYDHGPHIPGGPPGSPDEDGDRFIEIWNNVFMQFDMAEDGSVTPLPAPCVDTGMGLERLAAILQHVHSNYEIDLFAALIQAAARETGTADLANPSLKVIADHIRATAFLVSDGVIPSNEGRGYVQRRIVRRAIRHGYKLGRKTPFFHSLVKDLVAQMGDAYPKLREQEQRITEVLKAEEERFFETLANGMDLLDSALDIQLASKALQNKTLRWFASEGREEKLVSFKDDVQVAEAVLISDELRSTEYMQRLKETVPGLNEVKTLHSVIRDWSGLTLPGDLAFKLHDTYGFPLDLTNDVCRERGVTVDEDGFKAAMDRQKAQARAAGKFKMDKALEYGGEANRFSGYDGLTESAKIVAIYVDGTSAQALEAGQNGVVVLDNTPFYAESGGQVGDQGVIHAGGARFAVDDTLKIRADVYGHHGRLESGTLRVGDAVQAEVDAALRAATMRNHSVTHIMHKALREVLGSHVQQKGSLVNAERTRFDFAHNAPVTDAQIREIERRVNEEILANTPTGARVMDIESAQKTGAMMLFGEKYGETVRVLDIGTSRELCGGTHVARTGDIGLFKVVGESGVAAGVRRIEAVTGAGALAYLQQLEDTVAKAAGALRAPAAEITGRIGQALEQVKALEREVAALKGKLASSQGDELAGQAVDVKGLKVLAATLPGADAKTLRDTMDKLKDKLKSAAIVLAAVDGAKVQIAAGVTPDAMAKVKAGELVNFVASQVGGKGGGKPDMAMAGGTDAAALPAALASVAAWVGERA